MSKQLSIGGLTAVLLLSGLLVGAAHGGSGGVRQPQPIELTYGDLLAESNYPLRDDHGNRTAVMSLFRGELLDQDGDAIGIHRCDCINADRIGWTCTHILRLRSGPYTGHGQVVITGMFRGFNGEKLAVTGGTGAYANVRGYATSTVDGDDFVTTLYLLP